VVHFPELALSSRGLCHFGGVPRVWMDLAEREVAKGNAELFPQRFDQSSNDWLCSAAVRALEVAILHE
jgi:hypothetical protein